MGFSSRGGVSRWRAQEPNVSWAQEHKGASPSSWYIHSSGLEATLQWESLFDLQLLGDLEKEECLCELGEDTKSDKRTGN
jgi:hypothetical protein